ncbi:MAG: cyclase family protein [Candidatus Promineifilaceae bacterium]
MQLIDLSHTLFDGLITYKGLPAPLVCDFLSREASAEHYSDNTTFHIGKIEMVANSGTYIDAPFHRFADGMDVSELALESVAGLDGVVFRPKSHTRAIGRDLFGDIPIAGKAVLVETGWSQHWNTDRYFENHPYLTRDAALYLRDAGAALVGIDSLNIDDTSDGDRPVHTILLGANVLIVEHMTGLAQLPNSGFQFYAVPVKVKGMGTFPVRAFAAIA